MSCRSSTVDDNEMVRLETNIGPIPQLMTATTTAAMGAKRGTDTKLLAMSAYQRGADRFAM